MINADIVCPFRLCDFAPKECASVKSSLVPPCPEPHFPCLAKANLGGRAVHQTQKMFGVLPIMFARDRIVRHRLRELAITVVVALPLALAGR